MIFEADHPSFRFPDMFLLSTVEYIQENWEQNPKLSLAINTNLAVPDKLIQRMLTIAEDLVNNNKVREFIIFTSVEAIGKQAEYTRWGLKYDKFWENIKMRVICVNTGNKYDQWYTDNLKHMVDIY